MWMREWSELSNDGKRSRLNYLLNQDTDMDMKGSEIQGLTLVEHTKVCRFQ